MPKVDFYILSSDQLTTCYRYICRVIEKAYQRKHRVYVYSPDQTVAKTLDELLWTFQDTSFIPHTFLDEGPEPPPPVQFGLTEPTPNQNDILVNLDHSAPEFHHRFKRILEFIPQVTEQQTAARDRFRFYKDQGYDVTSHNISKV